MGDYFRKAGRLPPATIIERSSKCFDDGMEFVKDGRPKSLQAGEPSGLP